MTVLGRAGLRLDPTVSLLTLWEKVDRPEAETDEGYLFNERGWGDKPLIRPSGTFSHKGRRET
jgi:hypothetical protein